MSSMASLCATKLWRSGVSAVGVRAPSVMPPAPLVVYVLSKSRRHFRWMPAGTSNHVVLSKSCKIVLNLLMKMAALPVV